MEDSVAAKSKLPTKMFFISSSVFQSCALDSADLDLGQVVAGLSKGSLSIAGHSSTNGRRPLPNAPKWDAPAAILDKSNASMRNCSSILSYYLTATSQIFSRLDLPSGPSTCKVTVKSPPLAY